jgi:hypothetical protein
VFAACPWADVEEFLGHETKTFFASCFATTKNKAAWAMTNKSFLKLTANFHYET